MTPPFASTSLRRMSVSTSPRSPPTATTATLSGGVPIPSAGNVATSSSRLMVIPSGDLTSPASAVPNSSTPPSLDARPATTQ